jgi:hypothetical protein
MKQKTAAAATQPNNQANSRIAIRLVLDAFKIIFVPKLQPGLKGRSATFFARFMRLLA